MTATLTIILAEVIDLYMLVINYGIIPIAASYTGNVLACINSEHLHDLKW